MIQYAANASFKGKKSITVKDGNTTAKTIKNLKSKKTCFVRVKAYKMAGGKKIYTKYGTKKKVRVK